MRKTNAIRNSLYILCIATASVVAMSFSRVSVKKNISLHIRHTVSGKDLIFDKITYKNRAGQEYTITNFKYYISNIKLIDDAGHEQINADSYYLVRHDDSTSMDIELTDVPSGKYKSISFLIGVDSLHNCSGAQSGALDPVNGMFWTWNQGYIFFKLEGKSPSSKSSGGIYEYHIGGYKAPANCIRPVTLDLSATDQTSNINLTVDVAKIMDGKSSIDLTKMPTVTDFRNAPKVADNYQGMFSIDTTHDH